MKITVDGEVKIVVVRDDEVTRKLDALLNFMRLILQKEVQSMEQFDQLKSQVQATTEVARSAVVLINGIADRIAAAGVDPAKLQELTESLKASDQELAAAVVANTPPAP